MKDNVINFEEFKKKMEDKEIDDNELISMYLEFLMRCRDESIGLNSDIINTLLSSPFRKFLLDYNPAKIAQLKALEGKDFNYPNEDLKKKQVEYLMNITYDYSKLTVRQSKELLEFANKICNEYRDLEKE